MNPQSYTNHSRIHPLFHYVLMPTILLLTISSLIYVITSLVNGDAIQLPIIILLHTIAFAIIAILTRTYANKNQDRTIRAEQNLRHYVLTGRMLDPKLTMPQIIALRFAADEEFPQLAVRATTEGLSSKQIKTAIQHWTADHDRI